MFAVLGLQTNNKYMLFLLRWSGCARPINRLIPLCLAFNETVFYPFTVFEDKISFVSLFFPLILGSLLFIPDPVSYLIRYVLFVRLFLPFAFTSPTLHFSATKNKSHLLIYHSTIQSADSPIFLFLAFNRSMSQILVDILFQQYLDG